MTLDDTERQNRGFMNLWWFRAATHISRAIAPKSIEIDMDKLHMKFSALNVDFNSAILDFLGSRKPAHEGIKEWYPVKVVILPLLASLSWKWLQIGMGMLPITTSTSDELFSRVKINDFERP